MNSGLDMPKNPTMTKSAAATRTNFVALFVLEDSIMSAYLDKSKYISMIGKALQFDSMQIL
jgi:hypothetical protein